jgi:superfamily II DNA/RNA helicase
VPEPIEASTLPSNTSTDSSTESATDDVATLTVEETAVATVTEPLPAAGFAELGVFPQTVAALEAAGITHPFPIQAMTLPLALTGGDVIGQAKTGTGKTLGFGIPLVQRIVAPKDPDADELAAPGKPQALVVVPTRELCVQVTGDLDLAGKRRGVRTLSVYGGRSYEPQVEALKKGIDVVVGTPGRLLDLARQRHLDLSHVKVLVLDEADEMLDLGFLPDVERIVAQTPELRQTMLFSATMPGQVVALARRYMRRPTHIRAADPDDAGVTVAATEQHVFRAHALDKVELLARLLQAEGRGLTMVFCRTKRTVAKVADALAEKGFASGAVHGDLGQGAREQALRAFRSGKIDVLVATDVAARGIDVADVTHVVNYQCPEDEKMYVHRIGRTGRAGASGIAVTFVDWDDVPRWALINKALDLGIPEPEETYSTSEHFYEELNIPAGTTGELPRARRVRAGLDAEQVEDLGETGAHAGARRRPPAKGGSGGGKGSGERSRDGASRQSTRTERPPRTDRARRRTRGGRAADDSAAVGAAAVQSSTDGANTTGGDGAPRRRRRRGGRGGTGAESSASTDA